PSISPPHVDPHKFLMQIGSGRSTSSYARNADVFVQGEDADSVFYLQDGRVKVSMTERGEETTLAILEAGQFFGDGCLGGQTHRIVTTKALTECRITRIDKTTMIEALDKQPWPAIAGLFRVMSQYVGNLPPMPGVFPDYPAPVG